MRRLDRARSLARSARTPSGRAEVAGRVVTKLAERLNPTLLDSHLRAEDVADLRGPLPAPDPLPPGRRAHVGFVMSPPGAGSGGHTTLLRMVRAVEEAGHRCTLLFHDPFRNDLVEGEAVLRRHWPEVRAGVRSVRQGFEGLDAVVASAWQTAHVVARHGTRPLHRFYFIQDFEPHFYPRGTEATLAEETYRFGFHNLALGPMVAGHVREVGGAAEVVPFGCDLEVYGLEPQPQRRDGVVFYARAGTPRRGFLMACLALEELHRRRPEVPVHAYGHDRPGRLPFPVVWHGRLDPVDLNRLYNRTVAGLGLSFTNISLVVEEMRVAGCVPVVNDSPDTRVMVEHDGVIWARSTPHGLADALEQALDEPDPAAFAARVASTRARGWEDSQREFVRQLERRLHGPSVASA